LREQEFNAFSLFETDGVIEDIEELAGEIFLIVNRDDVRYFEKLDDDYMLDGSSKDSSDPATNDWSGFDYLDGVTCSVIGDDYIYPDVVPEDGEFTTDGNISEIEVGRFFAAKIKLLPIEYIDPENGSPTVGDAKRLVYVNIRMKDSLGVKVQSYNRNYSPPFRKFGLSVFDKPAENFTGFKKVFIGGVAKDTDIIITQDYPLPFTILSVGVGVK
jgi:hypothetical protein